MDRTVKLTQEEVDYIDKKLCMSRFSMEDFVIVEKILIKLGKLERVKTQRMNQREVKD